MPRPYEYEEKDEWDRDRDAADRLADVDHYIASLDDPKEKYAASVTQRLAVVTSLLNAITNGLDHIIPQLRDGHYGVAEDDMFVTMLGDTRKEVRKTEELMQVWETAYGQES